ncbi:MAG: hypothetical protein HQL51_08110 [Magnetococcales bacterium]|nr:hypothetical protein [Magnetococcales bacterium]
MSMSRAIPFDPLAFAKELETAGIPAAHAEAQAKALSAVMQKVEETRLEELATRGDLADLKSELIKRVAGMFVAQTTLIMGAIFAMLKLNAPVPQPPLFISNPPAQALPLTLPPAK